MPGPLHVSCQEVYLLDLENILKSQSDIEKFLSFSECSFRIAANEQYSRAGDLCAKSSIPQLVFILIESEVARGVQTRPKPLGFFRVKKILSETSFGKEVKPWVPCRRFTPCKRYLKCYVEVGYLQAKFTGHFSPTYFHFWLLGSLEDD
jgi:hypothetical protein